jgi:peroxiredoxin
MKFFFLLPLMFAFSCKADNASTAITSSSIAEKPAVGADGKLEPVMGGPTKINIKINDYSGNGTARIFGFYADQNFILDTVLFKNGNIIYTNPKGAPVGLYYINIKGTEEYIQTIFGKDQEFDMTCNIADIYGTMKITGSDENQIFYDNLKFENTLVNPTNDAIAKIRAVVEGSAEYLAAKKIKDGLDDQKLKVILDLKKKYPDLLYPAFKLAGQNPKINDALPKDAQVPQFRKDFWNNVNFNDTRLLRTPVIGNKMKRYFKELTAQHQDSLLSSTHHLMSKVMNNPEYYQLFSNWVVLEYEPGKCPLMDAEALFVSIAQKYFTKEKAFWADSMQLYGIQNRANEMAASCLGKKAPNVISTDNFGKRAELYSLKSDYIVVYMYNPDCEHCQEQSPKLVKFYNENKAKGVEVFGIALDTDDAKWQSYIKKTGMSWLNVYDSTNRSIYGKYYVDVTPEIYVINKDRVIIGKNLKVDQINIVIDRDRAKRAK